MTELSPTVSGLLERDDFTDCLTRTLPHLGPLDGFMDLGDASGRLGRLLAPCDLQAIKAAGVTFAGSMIERVIEERAKGDPARAEAIRAELAGIQGGSLRGVKPGSEAAAEVKAKLQTAGMWSQYLEVGIGPDAEVFTKAPPMAAVGCGSEIGVHAKSAWNNPEPEVVLAVNSGGRSALLLGKAKDNNASAAIGPFIRLFDGNFDLETVKSLRVELEITGEDGFLLQDHSDMGQISRTPEDIAAQTLNRSHQYPDGFVLYLGTMFAPTKDRNAAGQGFTHHRGDKVTIASAPLGKLVNTVRHCDEIAPWTFGTRALMENLVKRGAFV